MQEFEENNTKTIQRLQEYITDIGISFNKLSLDLGISNSYFSKMVRNNGSIGSDILENILRIFPNLSADWLLTGRGNKNRNDLSNHIAICDASKKDLALSPEESILYKMYQQEKAEKEAKIEEIGALKERIRQLENGGGGIKASAQVVYTKKSSLPKTDDVNSAIVK